MASLVRDQSVDNKKGRHPTLSVQKALRILETFSIEKPELSLVEIAARAGLSVSTAHRLLGTLEQARFLERNPQNGHYRLAIKMFELGSIVLHGMPLYVAAAPVLARLSTETGETSYLTVLSGREVLCIARIDGVKGLPSQFFTVGRRQPLYAGAASKVFLAYLPPEQAKAILDATEHTPYTPQTITDTEQLLQELPNIRKQGYALSIEEVTPGIMAVAAPVFDSSQEVVAAVSVSAAMSRLGKDQREELITRVQEAAREISIRLGYVPRFTFY